MFKLLFRLITVTMFIFFLVIGVAVWKGGEPFRIWGEGIIAVGHEISRFGDLVDELAEDSRAAGKIKEAVKKTYESEKED